MRRRARQRGQQTFASSCRAANSPNVVKGSSRSMLYTKPGWKRGPGRTAGSRNKATLGIGRHRERGGRMLCEPRFGVAAVSIRRRP
jgi:hypothetical protein